MYIYKVEYLWLLVPPCLLRHTLVFLVIEHKKIEEEPERGIMYMCRFNLTSCLTSGIAMESANKGRRMWLSVATEEPGR